MIVRALGYAGGATIDGVPVLVTSGNIQIEHSPAVLEPQALPVPQGGGGAWRGKTIFADGTYIVNGSLSFDLTQSSVGLLSAGRLFRRGYQFDVVMNDGTNGAVSRTCYATSVSASGSVGGLLSASVSFVSGKEFSAGGGTGIFMRENEPVGYWASGGGNIRDWSLSFSQPVDPQYLNGDDMWPLYMKVGICDATLEIGSYDRTFENTVIIATAGATITGYVGSDGYSFNGASDVGTYRHSFLTGTPFGQPGVGIT
jgi:hypothetical protein